MLRLLDPQGNMPDDVFRNPDGTPLLLFHGTCREFDEFSAEHIHSVGFHFGCRLQAEYRVRLCRRRWIIHAYLRQGRRVLDLLHQNDPGWQQPISTAMALYPTVRMSDMARLGLLGYGLIHANRMHRDENERRTVNARIAELLERKGYDSSVYQNQNEPRDRVARAAYCVFRPEMILPVDVEELPPNETQVAP